MYYIPGYGIPKDDTPKMTDSKIAAVKLKFCNLAPQKMKNTKTKDLFVANARRRNKLLITGPIFKLIFCK